MVDISKWKTVFWPVQWTFLSHDFALEFHGITWEIPITALLIMGNRWIINQCIYLIVDYQGKTNMGNMGNKNTSIINQLLITLITIMNQL